MVLLSLPVAVALTVLAISPPAGSRPRDSSEVPVADVRVALVGGSALPAFALADRLGAGGYDVVAVGPDQKSLGPATVVVYYERSDRAAAERLRNLLGVGTIRREQVFSPSSDVTILIGRDLQHT